MSKKISPGQQLLIHSALASSSGRASLMVLVSLGTIGLLILSLCKLFEKFLLIDTAIFNSQGGLQTFPIVHAVSNAYHLWRFEPIAGLIAQYLGADWAIWWLVFNFAIGCCALIYVALPKDSPRLVHSISMGFISAILLAVLFGLDSVIWGSLSWLPLLVAIIILGFEQGFELKTIVALLFISILLAVSANQVALLFALPMALYAWNRARYLNNKLKYQLVFALLVPAILVAFLLPAPNFERYTIFSHFVPNYLTPESEGRFGLIGPELDPSPIDRKGLRDTLRANFIFGGLIFFAILLTRGLLNFKNTCGKFDLTKPLWGVVFLLGSLIWATLENPNLAQISPISATNRLLPGLHLIPLDSIIFAFTMGCFLILLGLGFSHKHRLFLNLSLASAIFYFAGTAPIIWSEGANSFQKMIFTKTDEKQLTSLEDHTHSGFRHAFNALADAERSGIVSPGLHILINHGLSVIDDFYKQRDIKFQDIAASGPKLFSSPGTPDLLYILDGVSNTRSRVGKAPLKGNEWLLIELEKPTDAQGLWIRSEEFYWDYARSVQILVAVECQGAALAKSEDFGSFKEIFEDSSWEGYVKLSPQGVPFYGPAAEMKVIFNPQSSIRCILIKNRTADSGYDWSITQVLVAR